MNASHRHPVETYDTTLRDGAQGNGISYSVADKLRIAERLDSFGVQYIEGGWPGSNPRDIEFFQRAKKELKLKHAKLAAFGSTRKANVRVQDDRQVRLLLRAGTPVVTIFGKASSLHVKRVLRCSLAENLAMIRETIWFLKQKGRFVIFDAEHFFDGVKCDSDYAKEVVITAMAAGADRVVLCDTNGGALPAYVAYVTRLIIEVLRSRFGDKTFVGIHAHNDTGVAVANTLEAVREGACHVQGTVNGYGERTGNCDLLAAIACLQLKMDRFCVPDSSMPNLKELSRFVDAVANIRHNPRQPWVGSWAFWHKAGVHGAAVLKWPGSYEHIDPASVGNARHISASDLSGRANIRFCARQFGFSLAADAPEVTQILKLVKTLEHQGFDFESAPASFALLVRGVVESNPDLLFTVKSFHVSTRGDAKTSTNEATVKVAVGDKIHHKVGSGDGPVHALDAALRLALQGSFPRLKQVQLVDYNVRNLPNGLAGTAAKTRVLITSTDGKREWTTVGVSENIIQASLQALADSIEYYLLPRRRRK